MKNKARTTPAPCWDVAAHFPSLAGKKATTVRLHPRRLSGREKLPRDASRLGGEFLWPANKPWPVCEIHEIPFVGLLQLKSDDFPEVEFPKGSDLFQLLWCPQDGHEGLDSFPKPVGYWHRRSQIHKPLSKIPQPRLSSSKDAAQQEQYAAITGKLNWLDTFDTHPDYMRMMLKTSIDTVRTVIPKELIDTFKKTPRRFQSIRKRAKEIADELRAQLVAPQFALEWYIPTACRLLPERVTEFPPFDELPKKLQQRIRAVRLSDQPGLEDRLQEPEFQNEEDGFATLYDWELSAADGTKIGGYARWVQTPEVPACNCGQRMEHLLTLSTDECNAGSWRRWLPKEEHSAWKKGGEGIFRIIEAPGMILGDGGKVYVFICRRCKEWPIQSVMQGC